MFRRQQLELLDKAIRENEEKVFAALKADLGKPAVESYIGEVALLYDEIRYALKHIRKWMKPRRVGTPLVQAISSSHIYHEPVGVVLIIGPWNYPFQLLLAPLVGAIAAGNCAVIKPSELAPATSLVVREIISRYFNPAYVVVLEGGVEVSQALLAEKFDHIFFTGGTQVGKVIMQAAVKHLTPVTLELGGKSPCIVDAETDLDKTARRIVWGKFFNAGQTCVAPDYLLVPGSIKKALLERMSFYATAFFGPEPARSPDYARIINQRHFSRLSGFLPEGKNVIGGTADEASLYIAPTVKTEVSLTDKVMGEEIFGPILPVIEVRDLDEAIEIVCERPKPLALYFFSKSGGNQKRVLNEISFGGGCINDTLVHFGNPRLPFGGVGESGMGAYHGQYGFEIFSHRKAVVRKSFLIDPSLRYPPYKNRLSLLKRILG